MFKSDINYPKVSVIVPFYNSSETIDETLCSVESQTYPSVEIIVVNDGSNEYHSNKLKQILSNRPHVQLVEQPNKGPASARNLGARQASGVCFCFLDSDDVIKPQYLSACAEVLKDPKIKLVYTKAEFFGACEGNWNLPPYEGLKSILLGNRIPAVALQRSKDFFELGGFDESLRTHEDWDYWIRLLQNEGDVVCIQDVLFMYRKRSDGTSLIDQLEREPHRIKEDWQKVYNKHHMLYFENNLSFHDLVAQLTNVNNQLQEVLESKRALETQLEHQISIANQKVTELQHQSSEKNHIILNREQQLLAQSLQHSKYKKLWVNRLVKPLIKTEQAISSANTLRKGFGRLVKEKGSIGKAYQHLRRLRKTKGVREVKLLLRNQKKVTAHKHLSIREMFSIKHDESQNILSKKPIDIIIPVYNGYDFLRPLFESIIQNTTQRYRLLVVDDCSSDKRVFDLLKEIKTQTRNVDFVLLRNEQNMGFIASVNKLVAHTKNHFVILNTDTEVPLGWLERLMYPILRMDKVASTTPFTNSGTICSFPRYLDDNSLFLAKSVEFIDGFFRKVNFDSTFIEIPTGVGFCMGVNKQLVKQIGMFDPVYGKGYGEENDWCQKAISKGYRNIHVTNLFVYHKHGGSFATDEKLRLLKNNLDILNKRYPNYSKEVSKVITENCLRDLRSVLAMEIISNCSDLTVLIEHSLGGGAGSYVNDLLKEKLKNDSSVLRIKFDFHASKKYMIELNYGVNVFQYVADSLDELNVFLDRLRIQEILINSVVSYPEIERTLLMLIELRNKNEAHLVYPLHDFFPLCPSWTLVNENDEYCDIPTDYSVCARCLKNNTNDFKQLVSSTDITQWRKTWGNLLHHCDEIRCFSQSSIDIFEKCYPEHHVRLTLIPHNISGRFENIYELLSDEIKQSNIIGVLGAINRPKGFNMIKQMVKFIEENNLDAKIIVIGKLSGKINSKVIHVTGTYDIDDLPSLIVRMKIAKFFIPSVCPETYSYTTDEVMQLGYPLYVFNIGAPAERVLNYPLGRVIQFNEWKSIVQNNRTESV